MVDFEWCSSLSNKSLTLSLSLCLFVTHIPPNNSYFVFVFIFVFFIHFLFILIFGFFNQFSEHENRKYWISYLAYDSSCLLLLFFLNYISHLCSQFFPQFSFFIIKFQLTHLADCKNVKNLFSFSHFFGIENKNENKK